MQGKCKIILLHLCEKKRLTWKDTYKILYKQIKPKKNRSNNETAFLSCVI